MKVGGAAVHAVDIHVAGQPVRLVVAGYPLVSGDLADKLVALKRDHEEFRHRVLREPWGRDGMMGVLVMPPDRPASTAGLATMDSEEYGGLRGTAVLAAAAYLTNGPVSAEEPLRFDVPGGQETVSVSMADGEMTSVTWDTVARIRERGRVIVVGNRKVELSLVETSGVLALVSADMLGVRVALEDLDALVEMGEAVFNGLDRGGGPHLPVKGVVFTAPNGDGSKIGGQVMLHRDGTVDRSPGVDAVAARIAMATLGDKFHRGATVNGILGTELTATVTSHRASNVRVRVSGLPLLVGWRRFFPDSEDPVKPFLIR